MAVRLTYETHATTEDNEQGVATGWLPGRLSARGRREAVLLGERRRPEGYAAVLVSDLARAVETVAIAFAGSDVPVRQDARLRECDYGELNGCRVTDLDRVRLRHLDEPFPGGQSYTQVLHQTRDLLDEIRSEFAGGQVLLVAHSANRWALQHLLDGTPLAAAVAAPFDWQPGWEWTLT
ncbi:phosphoglycerate mutase [Humibacillus xanthopallidus]|uniref:Phosphoglycerate mutase n=1 Tax=Humibacillus xanthopallidus TaxID=412689 RepID=A0A543PRM2_9MICO|nr:histidine phosphatase family protein [Humibacillus xanthopallidus]TQN46721.1 phosphoglycerate mutase [Humibacillus xanthopallidus]